MYDSCLNPRVGMDVRVVCGTHNRFLLRTCRRQVKGAAAENGVTWPEL